MMTSQILKKNVLAISNNFITYWMENNMDQISLYKFMLMLENQKQMEIKEIIKIIISIFKKKIKTNMKKKT